MKKISSPCNFVLHQATISGTVDHTAFFQGERKRRLDRNKVTEQLLVRLERLLRYRWPKHTWKSSSQFQATSRKLVLQFIKQNLTEYNDVISSTYRGVPSDPLKRRSHEQSVVPWLPEDTVKLCPSCAKSFNIARRKHHCRLCGCVMCADCSDHVAFDLARGAIQLTFPSSQNLSQVIFEPFRV